MAVVDRWHQSHPQPGAVLCEHDKVPTPTHGRGDRWVARWRDPDGRQKKQSFAKKVDAERHYTAVTRDLHRGAYVDPAAGRVTVLELAEAWAATRPHRAGSAARVASLIRTHLKGTPLGSMPVSAVRTSDVQAWATGLTKTLAPSTAKQTLNMLRAVLNAAVDDGRIASTPARRVALPRAEKARVVPLTVAQVRALAAAMPERYTPMVVAQAGLGLRVGELLALRPEDVDFLRRTVTVAWQIEASTGRRTPPKTPRSHRTVPLPQVVADVLARHIELRSVERGRRLFPMTAVTYQAAMRKSLDALDFEATSHDLRHHYASVLLAAGESVVAVAELLGHDSAKLVLSTYGHLIPGREHRTRAAIDSEWCALDVPREGGLGV